jgi:hypothetical protein
MKTRILSILTAAFMALPAIQSCEKEENENETKISSYGSNESHHAGDNCMSCHISGGSGEGWFTIAGTVYDDTKSATYPNATVRLYSGPDGTGNLEATVEADQKGNFYTTESIDFGVGLYVLVEGDELTNYMNSIVNSGECNSCHQTTANRIWVR